MIDKHDEYKQMLREVADTQYLLSNKLVDDIAKALDNNLIRVIEKCPYNKKEKYFSYALRLKDCQEYLHIYIRWMGGYFRLVYF